MADAEELRERWGVEVNDAIPEVAADPENGIEAQPAVPKRTLAMQMASLRNMIPDDGEDANENLALAVRRNNRNLFGPASNISFVSTFMFEDPLLSQLVVYNANVGIFAGEIRHPLAAMVCQILTYLRYDMRGKLPSNRVERTAKVQSYACAELLGPYIPAERRMTQDRAQAEIIRAVDYGLENLEVIEPIAGAIEQWFSPLIGQWNTAQEFLDDPTNTTIDVAMALLMTWAGERYPNLDWLDNKNLFVNSVVGLSKRGVVSDGAAEKIKNGVDQDLGIHDTYVRPRTCALLYNNFGKFITGENAQALFVHLRSLVPNWSIRLALTIDQASGSGLTVYFLIRRAFVEFANFDWVNASNVLEADFGAYRVASGIVGNNLYYGFNNDLNHVRSTRYQSLGYLALQLCIKAGGDNDLRQYQGLRGAIKSKTWIDEAVTNYINQLNAPSISDERRAVLNGVLMEIRDNLGIN